MIKNQKPKYGFTIVELIVIIIVVSILAAIVMVSFGAWRKSIASDQVKSDLLASVSAMNNVRNTENSYPSTLPTTIKASEGVSLSIAYATQSTFCVNGTSTVVSGVAHYVTENESASVMTGSCPGSVSVPAAPTNLANTMASETTANFTWTPPAGPVTGYTTQCADDAGFIINKKEASSVAANVSLSGFIAESAYNCRVRAANSAGQGQWSSVLRFVSIPAPTNLIATTASSTQINVSWGAVGSASSYKLDWSTSSTFSPLTGTASGLTATNRNVTGLQQGVRYYFRVNAQSDSANGPSSTAANAITSITTPVAPVLVASVAGTGADDSVVWSWSATTCPSGTTPKYSTAIYKDDATGWRAWVAESTATSVSQATNGQGHEYMAKARVRCTTAVANSNYSAESNAPSFIRSISEPGIATGFYWGTYTTYDIFTWTPPTCPAGTTIQWRGASYARTTSNNGSGTLSTLEVAQDIFYNPVNVANAIARWKNPATVTSSEIYWPRVETAISRPYTAGSSPGWNVSWGQTDGSFLVSKDMRAFVQYRCLNATTNRFTEGAFVVSPMLTKSGGWTCDRSCQ